MFYKLIICIFCLLIINNFVFSLQSSAPVVISHIESLSVNNLSSIDNSADNLIQLKRKLEIEKAEAELKKLHNGTVGTNNVLVTPAENLQTIVTGVAINQEGKKIAWLQFADGGSLTVNIGSRVGKYRVYDISMSGVVLINGRRQIFLKRAYYPIDKPKQKSQNIFSPSPLLTNANTVSDDMVPPIVPTR